MYRARWSSRGGVDRGDRNSALVDSALLERPRTGRLAVDGRSCNPEKLDCHK